MKRIIPSMFALTCLAGCSFFDQETESFSFNRPRPASYGTRLSAVALGRLPSNEISPADASLQESMERQRQDLQRPNLYDNYTISVSPPPGAATAPVSPARGGASGYENLTSPTRSTPPPPPVASRPPAAAPMAKPVPGKQGYVLSPFSPDAGYIDVSGMPPGTEAKDPYTGKVFRVP